MLWAFGVLDSDNEELPELQESLRSKARIARAAAAEGLLPVRARRRGTVADGERLYEAQCASCHQASGQGVPNLFPPLDDSRWVTGPEGRLIRIILDGLRGPITVRGEPYDGVMPAWGGRLSNEQIAAVATYVRTSWSNDASKVTEADVVRVRAATQARAVPWTAAALLKGASGRAEGSPASSEEEAPAAGVLAGATPHPYPVEPPALYRTFMPESSPASIAVALKGGLSYCFDAGKGFLRYAWTGGFIDNSEIWKGHVRNQRARIIGRVFYRNEVGVPLRLGGRNRIPEVQFEGYRLIDGRPQFIYRIDGALVRELVKPVPEGVGLVRVFETEAVRDTLWFVTGGEGGVAFSASAGTWVGGALKLSPAEARRFTITMTRRREY